MGRAIPSGRPLGLPASAAYAAVARSLALRLLAGQRRHRRSRIVGGRRTGPPRRTGLDALVVVERLAVTGRPLALRAQLPLTTVESAGDTRRVVLGSPLAGIAEDEVLDITPGIADITGRLLSNPEYSNLPRKFKTAISGLQDVAHEINDVAFVGVTETSRLGRPGPSPDARPPGSSSPGGDAQLGGRAAPYGADVCPRTAR